MTVSELIEELKRQPPGKLVRVIVREVAFCDEEGDGTMRLGAEDSLDADEVRNEGPFVLIWGGRA